MLKSMDKEDQIKKKKKGETTAMLRVILQADTTGRQSDQKPPAVWALPIPCMTLAHVNGLQHARLGRYI